MSTGLLIVLIIVALAIVAALVLMPRMRAKAQETKREREIEHRREAAADNHRSVAQERTTEAERLEAEARARKAEADMHGEHAELHSRGMADDKLVRDDEPELAEHVQRSRLDRDADGRLDADDVKPHAGERRADVPPRTDDPTVR
jgi:type II secretory pathway pseudopilin PulG